MATRVRMIAGWVRDAGIVALLALAAVLVLLSRHAGSVQPRWVEVAGVAALGAASFAGRQRYPFGLLVGAAALALAGPPSTAFTLPLLLATVNVAYRRPLPLIAAAAVISGAACVGAVARQNPPLTLPAAASHLVLVGLAVAGGMYLAARRAHLDSLHDRANQREREQQLLTERAVADERVRIARELHDVVAHGVSLMVVQAQALEALEGTERDATGNRIAAIGREALTEMHRMLDVLRPQGDEAPELAPAPGVRDVAGLVERARGTGIDVALTIEGEPRALPAGADLSAYRIVQEALTNVIKHARALRTEVLLRYGPDRLELSVLDDGDCPAVAGPPGHGLVGMRERVALFGGTLEAGRRTDGPGYAVRAVLPL